MISKKYFSYIISLIIITFSSCGSPQQDGTQQETTQDTSVPVETQTVALQERPQIISHSGNIEAWESAYISGQTGMRINRILVDEGDRVKKGQLLAVMSSAQLDQAQTQLNLAKREVDRLDTLYRIGSVSGQRLDQAQSEYQNALSNYNNLAENTRLTAQFDGVITNRYFSPGEIFTPSATAPAILTLMQVEPVRVVINIAEIYYNRINHGMSATVRSDVFPGQDFTGVIHRKSPVINREARTFQTEIRIENKDRSLRPGMFTRVSINLGNVEGIYIPATAVISQPGTTNQFVFVQSGDVAQRVQVVAGMRHEELIRIESGLQEGMVVVTEGMGRLNDGTRIRVVNHSNQLTER